MLDEISSPLNIDISFSVFYRIFPTFEQQLEGIKEQKDKKSYSMERIWKRKDFSIYNLLVDPLNLNNIELDLSDLINEIKEDLNVVKVERKIPSHFMDSKEKFEEF